MIQQTPQAEQFKEQLRNSLLRETKDSRAIKIAKHANVYTCGDQDEVIYFIDSGQIKLLMHSAEGKECLLAIYTAGDIFGELCLTGLGVRQETATAMEDTSLKLIPSAKADCEQRLGKILLQLARKLGKKKDQRSIRIEHKISHEELAEMVGTTRPRISEFMQRFREFELIEISTEHFIIVKEKKLTDYLNRVA